MPPIGDKTDGAKGETACRACRLQGTALFFSIGCRRRTSQATVQICRGVYSSATLLPKAIRQNTDIYIPHDRAMVDGWFHVEIAFYLCHIMVELFVSGLLRRLPLDRESRPNPNQVRPTSSNLETAQDMVLFESPRGTFPNSDELRQLDIFKAEKKPSGERQP